MRFSLHFTVHSHFRCIASQRCWNRLPFWIKTKLWIFAICPLIVGEEGRGRVKQRPGLPRDRSPLFCSLGRPSLLKGIFTYAIFLSLSSFCWWGQSACCRCRCCCTLHAARCLLLGVLQELHFCCRLLLLLLRVVCCCLIFYKIGMKSAFPSFALRFYFSFASVFILRTLLFVSLSFFWHFIYFNFLISSPLCQPRVVVAVQRLRGLRAAGSGQGASATGVALTQAALSGQIEICYIKLFKCI